MIDVFSLSTVNRILGDIELYVAKFINYRVVYDTKDMIYAAFPYFWWFLKRNKSLAFNILHKNIGSHK